MRSGDVHWAGREVPSKWRPQGCKMPRRVTRSILRGTGRTKIPRSRLVVPNPANDPIPLSELPTIHPKVMDTSQIAV